MPETTPTQPSAHLIQGNSSASRPGAHMPVTFEGDEPEEPTALGSDLGRRPLGAAGPCLCLHSDDCRGLLRGLTMRETSFIVRSVIAWQRDELKPLRLRLSDPEMGLAARQRVENLRGFSLSGRCGTTVQRYQASNRHMLDDGFWRNAVARGCRSQDGRRIATGAPVDRLQRCTDAAAPGNIEAGFLFAGLAFLRPQPLTKKHLSTKRNT